MQATDDLSVLLLGVALGAAGTTLFRHAVGRDIWIGPENLPARIGGEEDPRDPHPRGVGLVAEPLESQVAA